MDEILAKASSQAVTFAIRSGISLASGFAIKTVTKFLDKIPENEKRKIINGRNKIQTKVSILSVSIDLVKLVAARGNTSLGSTIELIDSLNEEIDSFDKVMNDIVQNISNINEKESIQKVERMMKDLLENINEAIPLINLSLITCGVSLEGNLPDNVSPGRLLQASNYLIKSNEAFDKAKIETKVGPMFDLVFYSIFYNPSRLKYITEENPSNSQQENDLLSISWKEDFARCLGQIVRTIDADRSYAYKFQVTEDFNDGRYHEDDVMPMVKSYNISLVKRLFFSASGKLLRLESRTSPVLIFKIVDEATEKEEWVAFGEVGSNEFDDDDEEDEDEDDEKQQTNEENTVKNTSLSLLEYLVRLSTLQEHDSKSILDINDERISLYLKDESTSASMANQGIIPKSKKVLEAEKKNNDKTENMLSMSSNVNRLENLNLHN
ncbi:Ran-binding-domain-containing protein [Hyphopichia burtonii NRRL Y-1933]|uniref:Ran-binding-domain-containing protein n=1 Tax=Hyphopichia burtonii NRRL Y-1933 TaxID=984485 RepID=A0A1E4RRL6_9ASCO|nr:Ran-binding-domain-containing protein [Hyphopichia burtonii NRRL Y-1933]ODV69897.1 Ran-binding-domain-containing protein [Hyphopichia burtonii NRRL Y-1933]